MNCQECNSSKVIEELKERIKDQEQRLRKIEEDRKLQNYQYEQIMQTLKDLKLDVNEIKDKPNKYIGSIITSLITGVIAFLVATILN